MLSLLDANGYSVVVQSSPYTGIERGEPIDRRALLLPEILLEDGEADLPQLLKPAFDSFWNASGVIGSPSYKGGKWTESF